MDEREPRTAEIVNLRLARKTKKRRDSDLAAARNRVEHGIGKADRARAAVDRRREDRNLDGLHLEKPIEKPKK